MARLATMATIGNDGGDTGNGGSTGNGNGNGNGGDTGSDLIQIGVDDDGIAFSHTGFPLGLSCPLPKIFQFFKLSVQ